MCMKIVHANTHTVCTPIHRCWRWILLESNSYNKHPPQKKIKYSQFEMDNNSAYYFNYNVGKIVLVILTMLTCAEPFCTSHRSTWPFQLFIYWPIYSFSVVLYAFVCLLDLTIPTASIIPIQQSNILNYVQCTIKTTHHTYSHTHTPLRWRNGKCKHNNELLNKTMWML